jgi:hypothetical protein
MEKSHLYGRVYFDDWARCKSSKSATFAYGLVITHGYHTPLIFIRKTYSGRANIESR